MNLIKKSILLSYICVASISATIITPALPEIQNSFHLTIYNTQWVISIFLFGYVIGQLIYGPIANRFGSLSALRYGLVVNLIGIILCLMAVVFSNYHMLLFGRLITALGAASGLSCTFMLIHAYLSEKETQQILSFCTVSFTVGLALAILIGGILTEYLSWEHCFIFLLAHGLISLCSTWLFDPTDATENKIHIKGIILSYLSTIKNSRLIIFSLLLGSVSMFSYGYATIAPLFATAELHLSPSSYGYWNLLTILGMFLGGILSSVLMKKIGAKNLLILSIFLVLPCLFSLLVIALSHSHNILWFFITTMVAYAIFSFIFPAASYFATTSTSNKASASSMMSFLNMTSATLGVILISYLPIAPILALVIVLGLFFIIISISSFIQLRLIQH